MNIRHTYSLKNQAYICKYYILSNAHICLKYQEHIHKYKILNRDILKIYNGLFYNCYVFRYSNIMYKQIHDKIVCINIFDMWGGR